MEKSRGVAVHHETALQPAEVIALREIFDALDTDGSNSICIQELSQALDLVCDDCGLSKEAILSKFLVVDTDGSGVLDFKEFLTAMAAGWASTRHLRLRDEQNAGMDTLMFFEFCAHFNRLRILEEVQDTGKSAWMRHQAFRRLFAIQMIPSSGRGDADTPETPPPDVQSRAAHRQRRRMEKIRARAAARHIPRESNAPNDKRQRIAEAIVAHCGEQVRCFFTPSKEQCAAQSRVGRGLGAKQACLPGTQFQQLGARLPSQRTAPKRRELPRHVPTPESREPGGGELHNGLLSANWPGTGPPGRDSGLQTQAQSVTTRPDADSRPPDTFTETPGQQSHPRIQRHTVDRRFDAGTSSSSCKASAIRRTAIRDLWSARQAAAMLLPRKAHVKGATGTEADAPAQDSCVAETVSGAGACGVCIDVGSKLKPRTAAAALSSSPRHSPRPPDHKQRRAPSTRGSSSKVLRRQRVSEQRPGQGVADAHRQSLSSGWVCDKEHNKSTTEPNAREFFKQRV